MKTILEKLKKFNTPLHYGIICAVFGVAFAVLPYIWKPALDILLISAGVFSIFLGILTVSLLDTSYRGISYYISVGKTLFLIGFGIFLIISRSSLAWMLCIGYGLYLVCRGTPMLLKSVILPKTDSVVWWIRLVLSIFEIILGLWLVVYPKWPSEYLLAGAALIITAIELFAKHSKKEKEPPTEAPRVMFGTVYDTDFEDKT